VPATVDGVRTVVIPANARAVAAGSAPQTAFEAGTGAPALTAGTLGGAMSVKQQVAHTLMKKNPAFFGVGVGQSLDNPREAALAIYVDRKLVPAQLPATIGGLRTHYVVMDRLHVTRSYAAPVQSRLHCLPRPGVGKPGSFNLLDLMRPRGLSLN
jgi:hypothetical protein